MRGETQTERWNPPLRQAWGGFFFFFFHRWCEISHGVQAPLSSLRWSCTLGPDWLVFIDLTWGTTPSYLGGCFSGRRECFEGISRISHATLIIVVDKPWLTSHDYPEGHELPFFLVHSCDTMQETEAVRVRAPTGWTQDKVLAEWRLLQGGWRACVRIWKHVSTFPFKCIIYGCYY